jgi:pyridoxal phosphate-dependent aminotransferase EpsN
MPEPVWSRSTRWLSALTIDPARASTTRDDLLAALAAERIEARPTWKPMHLQPLFAGCRMFAHERGRRPVCERLFEQGLCLPSGSAMDEQDLSRVIAAIERAFAPTRAAVA